MGLGLSLGIGWRGFGVNFGIWGMVGDGLRAISTQFVGGGTHFFFTENEKYIIIIRDRTRRQKVKIES